MGYFKTSQTDRLNTLKRAFSVAEYSNPIILPDHPSPPTVTVASAADATGNLGTAFVPAPNAAGLNSQINAKMALHGGVPLPAGGGGGYMAIAAASYLPNTSGNLASFANSLLTADMNQRAVFVEFETITRYLEACFYLGPTRYVTLDVDGFQVRRNTLLAGVTGGNADNFLQVDFGSKGPHLVRLGWTGGGNGLTPSLLKNIRVDPNDTIRLPDQSRVLRAFIFWDSMGEGFPYTLAHPRQLVTTILCDLLGIKDVWNFSVGSTGYLADNGGTRSKLSAQITRAFTLAATLNKKPDIVIVMHGYNDVSLLNSATITTAQLQAEAQSDMALIRQYDGNVPVVVIGAEQGTRNGSANTLAGENAIKAAIDAVADPYIKFGALSTAAQPYNYGTGYTGATVGSGANGGPSDAIVGADGVHFSNPIGNLSSARVKAGIVRDAVASMG